jgi:SSS family solute:Na+ symporter
VHDNALLAAVNGAYLVVTLVIGWLAWRRTTRTAEDYFLGGRSTRTLVLFMAVFGTNVTPFVLLGIPGLSYHHGVGIFGLNAAIVGLGIPLTFWLIGHPARLAARRIGAITPVELYSERFASPMLGHLLYLAFFAYTVPYMVTAVIGVGLTAAVLTAGAVPFAAATAGVLAITIAYTALGGMRATMWTNVFQGATFMVFMLVAFAVIAGELGGLQAATAAVAEHAPQLLIKGDSPQYQAGHWASWALAISLTVIAFPHMFVRLFAARDTAALKNIARLYPLALVLLWVPAVLFGVWGAAEFPGLVGRESDAIFPMLVARHLGPFLQGLALAGVLAAVMSTLDAQLLTLSSMLTRDVLRKLRPGLSESTEIAAGRLFTLALSIGVYLLVLRRPASIFDIAAFSFSGYVTLVPTLLLGLRWRRCTGAGAIASILAGNAALLLASAGLLPAPYGVLPVAWGLLAAIAGAVLGSLLSRPTAPAVLDRVLGRE